MLPWNTKEINIIRTIPFILFLVLHSISSHSSDIYVSPEGRDANSGTLEAPFATIDRALDAAKELFRRSLDKDCTIWLGQGVYRISKPIALQSVELQNNNASLTIAAIPGTKPVISGGLEVRKWKRASDGQWKAILPDQARGNLNPRELFINGRRAVRARHPNQGYIRIAIVGEDRRTNFYFNEGDFPLPSKPEETELILLHDWSISRIPIKTIDASKNKLTTVDSIGARQPDFFNIDNWEPHPRYFLENDQRFLDADYEWYYDKDENAILIQLPSGQDPNDMEINIPVSKGLLILSGTKERPLKNIRFEGLVFEHSAWIIPDMGYAGIQACHFDARSEGTTGWAVVSAALQGEWVSNTTFLDCTFRHLGGSGLWMGTGSVNNTIVNCEFSDISGNGIMIGEGRDRQINGKPWWKEAPEQVASGNTIEKSTVTDCGVQFFGAVGIWCGLTAETTIRDNEIYELPYTGISIGWMWSPVPTPCRDNILSGNYIHHIMEKLSDGGGIYMLGLQPGSKILHNRIHDVSLNAGRAESNGLFLDEGITDVEVAGNLIYEITKSPIRFHKATTNIVRDNQLFCKEGVPAIRYNATDETDIVKIDNQVVTEGENGYRELLQVAIKQWESQ